MISFSRLTAAVVFLVSLFVLAAPVHSQGQIDSAQLSLLQQLSPEEREEFLNALVDPSGATTQRPLAFPELVDREAENNQATEVAIYDEAGNPVLDDNGRPVLISVEMLEELKAETPDDWLRSEIPFFEQEIRLRPFGYDLFEGVPTTFAPATDIPVPNEYRLGPGDTIDVQLFGKENRQYSLVVNRDGTINFPNIGPVNVMGQSFQGLKQDILDRVAEQLIGTSASVTMGSLRSVNVVVVGDAKRPGTYTVSGLSTITNALFVSGGVGDVGSLRDIQLKREGKIIARLDLYDLLLRGDARNDLRLESGDVIFIPPVGPTVGVGGFVKRPAIYELRKESTLGEIVKLAGGLRADAYPEGARVERIDGDWKRTFVGVDLNSDSGLKASVKAGDIVLVPPVLQEFDDGVQLRGHVERPGSYEWAPGMRLTDLISGLNVLQPQADLQYVLVRRETAPEKRVRVLSANLAEALANPASPENITLQARDRVSVFALRDRALEDTEEEILEDPSSRTVVVTALLDELSRQAGADMPFERVSVAGEVRVPGEYPFEDGMRISDLLRAGGGLTESAFDGAAELTRYRVVSRSSRTSDLIEISLDAVLRGDAEQDLLLEPSDFLTVRRIQDWANEITVTLDGEVRYPGTYAVRRGETLTSVIARAGGLTDQAFPAGSVFLRDTLREREQEQIISLRERLRSDIAQLSLQAASSIEETSVVEARSAGTALLASLNSTEATGRLVIDLGGLLDGSAETEDVLLEDGDQLLIPKVTQAVTVLGEVQFSTSHLHVPGLSRDGYIGRSGGLTANSAKKAIYVVRANGAVVAGGGSSKKIYPGDTIVVPLDTQKGFRLQSWANITKIVYNTAIAVAAINGISN